MDLPPHFQPDSRFAQFILEFKQIISIVNNVNSMQPAPKTIFTQVSYASSSSIIFLLNIDFRSDSKKIEDIIFSTSVKIRTKMALGSIDEAEEAPRAPPFFY